MKKRTPQRRTRPHDILQKPENQPPTHAGRRIPLGGGGGRCRGRRRNSTSKFSREGVHNDSLVDPAGNVPIQHSYPSCITCLHGDCVFVSLCVCVGGGRGLVQVFLLFYFLCVCAPGISMSYP
ncbi:unnamed protein product [Tuber aestivum]|uniref:Uncharacterized protein n=1 Tax=Tuber aestivum TaxID=59557 RepID=A0A292PZY1_9PEZI|nr:unnamed protein product [Tuber aestivum]